MILGHPMFWSKCYPGLQSKNGHLVHPKKMLQEWGNQQRGTRCTMLHSNSAHPGDIWKKIWSPHVLVQMLPRPPVKSWPKNLFLEFEYLVTRRSDPSVLLHLACHIPGARRLLLILGGCGAGTRDDFSDQGCGLDLDPIFWSVFIVHLADQWTNASALLQRA